MWSPGHFGLDLDRSGAQDLDRDLADLAQDRGPEDPADHTDLAQVDREAQDQDILKRSSDFIPQRDLRRFGDELSQPRERRLQVRFLHVRIPERFGGPVLVEKERARLLGRFVHVVIQAAGILAARRYQTQQLFSQLGFFAGGGLGLGNNS